MVLKEKLVPVASLMPSHSSAQHLDPVSTRWQNDSPCVNRQACCLEEELERKLREGTTSTHQTEDAEDEEARIQHCEPLCFSES